MNGKQNGVPYNGKKVENFKNFAPGQGHIAMTKPTRKGMIFTEDKETSYLSDKQVMYYPETIALRRGKGVLAYMIDVIYFDNATMAYTIELNMLVLSKHQVKELRAHNSEAMTLYEDTNKLAGSGNYCMTKPSSIACDLEIRERVYRPNQLVRFSPNSIRVETDNDRIEFYEIAVAYVNISPDIVAVELDKLSLSNAQLQKLREINPEAVKWYHHKNLSKQCVGIKELAPDEVDEDD
ncbi:MAG: hypothetical protein ACM3PZ_02105 [Bacillota bacterium]